MIDVFPINAHSDTICNCYGSANFLGRNYASDKHIWALKPLKNDPKIIGNNLFVQKNLVRWVFWKKYVTQILALKWQKFEYLGFLCFFHNVLYFQQWLEMIWKSKFRVKNSRKILFNLFYKNLKKLSPVIQPNFAKQSCETTIIQECLTPLENCRFHPMTPQFCCAIAGVIF